MGYDRKYGIVTTQNGDIPEDEPVIVFRGRDRLLPAVLNIYMELCEIADSPERHIELVSGTYEVVSAWQRANPDKVKTPDSERFFREWMTDEPC
jgi:hypothetical protein